MKRALIIVACIVVFNSTLLAQEATPSRSRDAARELPLPARSSRPDSGAASREKGISSSRSLAGTAVSLALVVGVLLLVGRGMKKYGFRGTPALPIEAFELLGRRTIEPRVTVHLVRCGSRVLVLGVGAEGVRTLSEIDDPLEVERLTQACQPPTDRDRPSESSSRPTPTGLAAKASAAAQRLFLALATLGLLLTGTSRADAQATRGAAPAARSREMVPVRPAVPEGRRKDVEPAKFEQALPLEIDPRQLTSPQQLGLSLKMLALMTVFSLAPAILMMTTCFVRFAVALGLLRQALGTQQGLPNQVLTAICMFLTFLVMSPIWQRSYDEGIRPYTNPAAGESSIDESTALSRTVAPVRTFMGQQIDMAGNAEAVWMLLDFQRPAADSMAARSWKEPQSYDDVPLTVLAPAYLLSELKVGFLIGFQLFLPFLVIDLVVAMILTSLGLTMMPPAIVSLPFKLLLFVLIDGWFLTVGMLLESVRVV